MEVSFKEMSSKFDILGVRQESNITQQWRVGLEASPPSQHDLSLEDHPHDLRLCLFGDLSEAKIRGKGENEVKSKA